MILGLDTAPQCTKKVLLCAYERPHKLLLHLLLATALVMAESEPVCCMFEGTDDSQLTNALGAVSGGGWLRVTTATWFVVSVWTVEWCCMQGGSSPTEAHISI